MPLLSGRDQDGGSAGGRGIVTVWARRQGITTAVSEIEAVKLFARLGHRRPKSRCHSRRGGILEIAVTGTGIGIAPEDQAAIFEEFRQVGSDETRKQEGTGVGLNPGKKFVELQGGTNLGAEPSGLGSTFIFYSARAA